MGDKEITISIRMGTEDIQKMEDFMAENKIDSRSSFIRDAIAGHISSQRRIGSGSGFFIRFNEVQMETLRLMVEDGTIFSEEEYIRKCVTDRIVSPESEADSANRSFKAAQMSSKMK
ncbi:MAG: ribbon-helix-helix domain-containing protein [Methanomassiliicoccaceae archaeon]|nr:ribbon-helix-helix domain-containing protein [Methanomassiliicoccaceae archaeon]